MSTLGVHFYTLREAVASPSAKCTRERPSCTRRRVSEVYLYGKGVFSENRKLCTQKRLSREPCWHSEKSWHRWWTDGAVSFSLFLKNFFPECNTLGRPSSPSAATSSDTRGRNPLPRAPRPKHSGKPLWKFFFFFLIFHIISKAYIYHKPQINSNISQTIFIYITNNQICKKFKIYYKPHVQQYTLFQVHKFNT